MKARNRAQYVAAWQSHVAQLAPMLAAADIPYEEYEALKQRMGKLIETAADRQQFEPATEDEA